MFRVVIVVSQPSPSRVPALGLYSQPYPVVVARLRQRLEQVGVGVSPSSGSWRSGTEAIWTWPMAGPSLPMRRVNPRP